MKKIYVEPNTKIVYLSNDVITSSLANAEEGNGKMTLTSKLDDLVTD